jgi:hypothetical protein
MSARVSAPPDVLLVQAAGAQLRPDAHHRREIPVHAARKAGRVRLRATSSHLRAVTVTRGCLTTLMDSGVAEGAGPARAPTGGR